MPTFEITSPDGKKYRVTGPEGSTQEEALARVKAQHTQPTPRAAPGSEPLPSMGDFAKEVGGDMASGFATKGFPGLAMAGAKDMGKLMDRGAYKTGGAVTDALAPYVSPEVAGGAGYAANVGVQALPVLIGALTGKAAQPVLEGAGKRVMHSALKPLSGDVVSGDADRAIQTLLDEGVNVTGGGAAKLEGMAVDLSSQVRDKIASSSGMIDKSYPASEIADALKRVRTQVNPSSDVNSVMKSWGEFNEVTPDKIPVQLAQELKQGTYKTLEGKYGELEGASIEAQKALARGLRKAIEEQVPEVGPLNKQTSDLLNALRQVTRREGMSSNRDILGLAPAAMNPKAAGLMALDRSSLFKSLLARLLYSAGPTAATGAGAGIGGLVGASSGQPQ